jgi:hypothetical protein
MGGAKPSHGRHEAPKHAPALFGDPHTCGPILGETVHLQVLKRASQSNSLTSPEDFGLGPPRADPDQRHERWGNAMQWLHEEGYLRCKIPVHVSPQAPGFHDVVLSEKGLRVLNSLPTSLALGGDKRSLALRLVEAAKQAGSKAAINLAQKGAEHGATQLVELVRGWLSD